VEARRYSDVQIDLKTCVARSRVHDVFFDFATLG
jgi:hypothetical protein